MKLEIISAEKILFEGEASMVTLPGEMGSFTVLQNHASLISVLVKGKIVYRDDSDTENEIEVEGGVVDVDNNIVSVCVY